MELFKCAPETGLCDTSQGLGREGVSRPIASLTPRQLGDVIGKSKWKMLNEIKAGRIRAVKLGNRYLIESDEALRYVQYSNFSPPPWLVRSAERFHPPRVP